MSSNELQVTNNQFVRTPSRWPKIPKYIEFCSLLFLREQLTAETGLRIKMLLWNNNNKKLNIRLDEWVCAL